MRERAREEFRRVLTHTFRREKEKWKKDGTFNDVPKTNASLFAQLLLNHFYLFAVLYLRGFPR